MLTKKAVIFVMALLLSACGYHLRGALELPANMKNVYVEGGSSPLLEQFKQVMKSSSAQLASSRQGAGIVIKVANEEFNRRVLSLSTRGKSNEFELTYRLDYEFANAADAVLMPRQSVEVRREYYNDQQFMIAKDQEEAVIRNEMYQQAVQTIVNRARVVLEAGAK
ncbi:MAG: LPS assembly lipoprotein LptE [Methylobacter sp.]|uniref:LPS-assembly lipoprotein LptE n=1 Tax=Methylobacter sp. TaxID=2051955 RepID=UPI0025EC8E37|nr:LPS assembly lipoprotein LptE [Methylobacter sp.]MCK9622878.1 LPS assembly lipoprotein LptE [Methylobacter sp.]